MSSNAMSIDDDLAAPEFGHDPYPTYRRLLASDSPHRSEVRGAWMVSRYDQVMEAFRDWRSFSSEGRVKAMLDHLTEEEQDQLAELQRYADLKGLIHRDPPDHTRLRTVVMKAFTHDVVEQMRSTVEGIVDDLLDPLMGRGEMDVVADLALGVPTAVITDMLGIPSEDRHLFVAWSDAALGLQGRRRPTLDVALRAQDGYVNLQDYFRALVADRRRNPRGGAGREDLLTSLIVASDEQDEFTDADLVQTCLTLLMGGYETTASLISNTIMLLLQHPDVVDRVRVEPELLAPAIEESLRYETPVQTITRRVARPIRVADAEMSEDDLVILVVGAANRDPRHVDAPDVFDITRESRHLAFGFGAHFCLGARLARLEAPIAVRAVLDRMPDLALADEEIGWSSEKVVTRCPVALNVTF